MMEDKQPPYNEKPRWVMYVTVGVVAAVTSVLIYASAQFFYQLTASKNPRAVLDNPARAADDKPLSPETGLLKKTSESFRSVAKKVGPAVVNIKATKGASKQQMPRQRGGAMGRKRNPFPEGEEGQGGGGGPDPFSDFFERFGHPFPFMDQGPQTSLGSGIIMDKKGIIVTNNHVVDGATEIYVSLASDKTEMKARVIGTDAKTDLAVLKVDSGRDLPAAEWADSDGVEVGDWAIAIGSPFALGQSVTVGIVSAKGGRNSSLTGVEFSGDLIQTDAAINPGNSGGPLADLDGRVIGINTAIYTRSGGYMGIGFAIPANLAKEVTSKLATDGKIVRGWLGVYIEPLAPDLAKELGVKEGVGIREVIENSPAASAGLKAGDVVLEVDGKPVKEPANLQRTIGSYKPGQSVSMKITSYADKKTRTVTVKVGKLPDETPAPKADTGGPEDSAPDKLGLVLSPSKDGMVVDSIQPGSVGEQAGLENNDIIVRINRKSVDSAAMYKKQLASAKRLFLEVKRKGRTLFIQLSLPE